MPSKQGSENQPQLKDEGLYEKLREEGNSKEKAARISNAAAKEGRDQVGRKGGKSGSYEDWTVEELTDRARELGLEGYSKLKKDELIDELRNH
nr:Rho termination factor N-terminal domain-containing protein [uncultured Rhodococcus sp.]